VIIHDNTPPTFEDDDSSYLARVVIRHHRLLHYIEPFLCEGVAKNPSGFDQALKYLWSEFRRQDSSDWHVLPSSNSRWISCVVEGGQEVHYNLLCLCVPCSGSLT